MTDIFSQISDHVGIPVD